MVRRNDGGDTIHGRAQGLFYKCISQPCKNPKKQQGNKKKWSNSLQIPSFFFVCFQATISKQQQQQKNPNKKFM